MKHKFLTKIAAVTLGLAMAVGVSVGVASNNKAKPVYADGTATWAMSASNKLDTTKKTGTFNDSEGNTWTWTSSQNPGNMQNNNTVQQIGANGSPATVSFSTSDITDNITSVSVECASYQGKHTIAITVGETSFLAATATPSWTTVGAKTGTGNATGNILISFAPGASARAMYIKSISVAHTSSGGDTPVQTSYTVSFNTMGGNEIASEVVAEGGTIATLPTPTKNNDTEHKIRYRFDGWYTVDDEDNPVFEDENLFTESTEVNGDITLFAKYTEIHYNVVTFNVNGGSSISNQIVDVGELVTKPNDPHKTDYFFDGWFTNENCQQGNEFNFGSTVIENDITLYAKWIDIPIETTGMFVKVTSAQGLVNGGKYLFVYESKAFDGSLASLDAASNTVDVVFDGDNIVRDNNTKSAYFVIDTVNGLIKSASSRYIGRTTYKNGLDDAYTPTSNYQNSISFDQNGNVVVTRQIAAEQSVVLKYNATAGQERFRYFTTGQEDIQLYRFVVGHTVTFVTNSEASIEPQTVLHGETLVLPSAPTKNPDSTNTYEFAGWYTNAGLTDPFVSSEPIESDLTLYAKYTAAPIDNPRAYLDLASTVKTITATVGYSSQNATDTITFEDEGIANGDAIPDSLIGGQVSLTCDGPKYYDSGTNMRVYSGNTFTLSYSANITSIVFAYSNGYGYNANFTASDGSFDADGWSGEATSITFTNSGSSQVRFTAITVTYVKQTMSVNTAVLRFGALIPQSAWTNISSKWEITDYGVMFSTTTALTNRSATSVENAFRGNAEKQSALYTISKGSGATPVESGDDYLFTARLTIAEDDHATEFCAAPFIVAGGEYYFLTEMRESVNSLATECLTTHDSPLSDAALTYLATH